MASGLELRPCVQWFAEKMEARLRENDHKGGWGSEEDAYLLRRLLEEAGELVEAATCSGVEDVVVQEATDVANFALMLAANWRGVS
jgi:phosphoribosyl-ATP pyrophosphohydrolase